MGPIQSGINQIFNQLMTTGGFIAGSKAIKGIKGEVEQTRTDITDLLKQKSQSASEALKKGDIETHLKDMEEILKNPKEAEEFFKNNPKYSEMLTGKDATEAFDKYVSGTLKEMREKYNIPTTEREVTDQSLEEWGKGLLDKIAAREASNKQIGNKKAAEVISRKAIQRSEFENLKNFTKNIQLPSSINKKVKHASLDRGMPNIKHMREAGDK